MMRFQVTQFAFRFENSFGAFSRLAARMSLLAKIFKSNARGGQAAAIVRIFGRKGQLRNINSRSQFVLRPCDRATIEIPNRLIVCILQSGSGQPSANSWHAQARHILWGKAALLIISQYLP
jgi:hypothetical protein